MQDNLIILQIVIPIFFAILTALISHNKISGILPIISSLFSIGGLCALIYPAFISDAMNDPDLVQKFFYVGSVGQYGIELTLDVFRFILLALVNIVFLSIYIYISSFNNYRHTFNTLFLLMHAGFCGVLLVADVFNLFVFLELSSIASYALCASLTNGKNKLSSIFEYLIFSSVAISLYLIGVAFIYSATGSLNIRTINELYNNNMIGAFKFGSFFMLSGVFLKLGLAPLHLYLVNTYNAVPSYMTAIFSGVISKINIFFLIIVLFKILSNQSLTVRIDFSIFEKVSIFNISNTIICIGLFSAIFFASLAAFRKNLTNKQILIYSSFSQIGYILIPLGLRDMDGVVALVLFIINHSFAKSGLLLIDDYDKSRENSLHNFKYTIKNIFFCFFLASIVSLPLTVGFAAKISLIEKLFSNVDAYSEFYTFLGLFLLTVMLSVIYSMRLFTNYFNRPNLKNEKNNILNAQEEKLQFESAHSFISSYKTFVVSLCVLAVPLIAISIFYKQFISILSTTSFGFW